ncbi:hypothetical protein GC209_13550 [bacterium]|nr:hypothetical protein [bacterium]
MQMRSAAAVLGLFVLAAGPLPSMLAPAAGWGAAYAESGRGNSSHGASASAHDNPSNGHATNVSDHTGPTSTSHKGNGALASELKGLNAVKANPNALQNAAPNSQVGRIATYRNAALATISASDRLAAAQATLAALEPPSRSVTAIDADIAALDPTSATYQQDLANLQAERANAVAYADAVAAVTTAQTDLTQANRKEHRALLAASDGRKLSPAAIDYVRQVLGL